MTGLVNVKRYARGAHWPDGGARMCVLCRIHRHRRRQATITATRIQPGVKYRLPVVRRMYHMALVFERLTGVWPSPEVLIKVRDEAAA